MKCTAAGILVVMITGDHIGTAKAIARELGIEGEAVLGEQIDSINLDQAVSNISIYARANPEHKVMVLEALRKIKGISVMFSNAICTIAGASNCIII